MSVEPYAVLFTNGDNDTFPLWYMQEVEDVRKDVTVIVGQYLDTLWYPKQLQRLTSPERQRPFIPQEGVDVYAVTNPPTSSIIRSDPTAIDRVTGGRLTEDRTIQFPSLGVTYPGGIYLDRTRLLALAIIRDSVEQRPIYFAATTGMMEEIGLERWGIRHGLARKLVIELPVPSEGSGCVRASPELGGEFFDVPRSLTLYDEVYRYRGLKDRKIWADRPSIGIPRQLYFLAMQLADTVEQSGGPPELVERLERDAAAFRMTAMGGTLVAFEGAERP